MFISFSLYIIDPTNCYYLFSRDGPVGPCGNVICGLFGYLGGSVAASAAVGYTVDHFGWDGGFVLLVGACLLSMAFLAPTLWHKQVASQSREAVA